MTANPAAAPVTAQYGSWASPLSAEALAAGGIYFGDLRSADGELYWTESVPAAAGAIALFDLKQGVAAPLRRRAPMCERACTSTAEHPSWPLATPFTTVDLSDQRVALKAGGSAAPVTRPATVMPLVRSPAPAGSDPAAPGLMAVRSRRSSVCANGAGPAPICAIPGALDLHPGRCRRGAVRGHRLRVVSRLESPTAAGSPSFPESSEHALGWNRTSCGRAHAAGFETPKLVAGGAAESVLEPQSDRDGTLYFISDRSGFWNLYAQRDERRACRMAARAARILRSVCGASASRTTCVLGDRARCCASVSGALTGWPSSTSRPVRHACSICPMWSFRT